MKAKKAVPVLDADEFASKAEAWPRFEQFIRDVARAGPQHREATKPKRRRRTQVSRAT
jgi:hypothetical protein